MGYNKENYRRIRTEYETKAFAVQAEAEARREELYREIPELKELDGQLSAFGLRIMQTALQGGDPSEGIEALRKENEEIRRIRAEILVRHGYPADYSDPHYECTLCKDSGYVGVKMCSCMRKRLIEAGMESSGLSGLIHKQSFENFSLGYYSKNPEHLETMTQVLKKVREYAHGFTLEGEEPMKGLLFIGGTGLGKTHLSTALAKTVIEKGYDVIYTSAVSMLSDFEQRRFGNAMTQGDADNTGRYTECDLLIIDDLGTEVNNQFTTSCIYHVVNTRLNLQRPTVISTNLSSAELRRDYSDRILSRLMGEYELIPFIGTDIRRQKLHC